MLSSPEAVHQLPAPIEHIVTSSFTGALHTTFLCAVPLAVLGFFVALFLPENRLRQRGESHGADEELPLAEPAF